MSIGLWYLSTHLGKLKEAGYVEIHKEFSDKKPHAVIQMTSNGRSAFRTYKNRMQQVLSDLPG